MAVLGIIFLALAVAGIIIVLVGGDRYRPRARSFSAVPTHEVLVDPVTSQRQRVHVDPSTGERVYVDEPEPMPGSAWPPLARPGFVGTPPVDYPPNALPPGGGHVVVPPGLPAPATWPPPAPPGPQQPPPGA